MAEPATAAEPGIEREGLRWLERFAREHGRPLRVLHLGNIANNAYNNAKIQRQRGIDADVVSWGYYHVMGSPEWEDAHFTGDVGDPFFPDWWAVDLHGYERPRWFVQGRLPASEAYLRARRRGRRLLAAALWRRVELERWLLCRRSPSAELGRRLAARASSLTRGSQGLRALAREQARVRRRHARLRLARRRLLLARIGEAIGTRDVRRAISLAAAAFRPARPDEASAFVHEPGPPAALATVPEPAIARRWAELFPERRPVEPTDFALYLDELPLWQRLLAQYDVVQAYGPAPIVPALCGVPFAAYEHGTLRELPFEESEIGRICALGYREAAAVFVTNSDVVPAARRLGIPEERLVFLPHAVDSDRLLRFAGAHTDLAPRRGGEVVFLAPSRQDWVDGDPSWTKGNDRAIRALALVRDEGLACRLLLADWGRHLEDTRRLVEELVLSGYVSWIPPLRKRALWKAYLSSNAVLDQFVLPAIGGVAFEAMALGRRVVTALDRAAAAAFFGAEPPLLAASEPEEIAAAMRAVIEDPLDERGLGASAQAWFARYHSADRIVDLQAGAYRRLLG